MSASITLEDLERRLTALQDIEDIESLKARYWRAVDRKRPDDVAACLTEDAIIDFEGLPRKAGDRRCRRGEPQHL